MGVSSSSPSIVDAADLFDESIAALKVTNITKILLFRFSGSCRNVAANEKFRNN